MARIGGSDGVGGGGGVGAAAALFLVVDVRFFFFWYIASKSMGGAARRGWYGELVQGTRTRTHPFNFSGSEPTSNPPFPRPLPPFLPLNLSLALTPF